MVYSNIDEDVRSLKEFSTNLVVEATARCLHAIDSSLDVQYHLPPSMAAQFRIGTSLATAVQVRFGGAQYVHWHFLYIHCVFVTHHSNMAVFTTSEYCIFTIALYLYFLFTVHEFSRTIA